MLIIIGIFVFALAFATGHFTRRRVRETRCPSCGKPFAMREVSRDQNPVSVYDTTMHDGMITRDLKGNITETDTRRVPAMAYVYNCVDECKFCGFQKEEQRTRVYKK